jgi:hypothetical protein
MFACPLTITFVLSIKSSLLTPFISPLPTLLEAVSSPSLIILLLHLTTLTLLQLLTVSLALPRSYTKALLFKLLSLAAPLARNYILLTATFMVLTDPSGEQKLTL